MIWIRHGNLKINKRSHIPKKRLKNYINIILSQKENMDGEWENRLILVYSSSSFCWFNTLMNSFIVVERLRAKEVDCAYLKIIWERKSNF